MGARDLARFGAGLARIVERPDATVGAQQAHPAEPREQLLALVEELVHLGPADLPIVRVGDVDVGRAEDRHGPDRDHDVPVGRLVAAVDHRIGHALVEHEHRALAGRHRELCPGHCRDLPAPRTGGRHHLAGHHAVLGAAADVDDPCGQQPLARAVEPDDAVVRQRCASERRGIGHVALDQRPRLDRCVRNGEGAPDPRVEVGIRRRTSATSTSSQSTSLAAHRAGNSST